MTQARRTAGIVARAALWATWAAAMVFAPAAMHYFGYVESVPAGWEHLFDLWFFVPWSAAPVFALAVAALAYAYRDGSRLGGARPAWPPRWRSWPTSALRRRTTWDWRGLV